ncbi:metallophosphoesterase family protein [Luteimonas sp. MJ204]|uniref:metallophosphoesterase family protein n=1 Tax=Luteimonas sp. MJ145 TaxID=3129234 RepID=UPI0031BA8517
MTVQRALGTLIPGVLAAALLPACGQAPESTPLPAGTPAATGAAADAAGDAPAGDIAATVDAIRARMQERIPAAQLGDATADDILALVDADELQTLSTGFLRFTVDAPATIHVMQSPDSDDEPFWLSAQGFERSGLVATVDDDDEFRAWSKSVPAGEVALGVPSIEGGVKPYFVLVGPAVDGGEQPGITAPQPARMGIALAVAGTGVFADDSDTLDAMDPALQGLAMLQTLEKRENEAALLGWFRNTPYPGGAAADQVVLTWAGDPATQQSIQWRTAIGSANARLRYSAGEGTPVVVEAASAELHTPDIANDPRTLRHTVALEGLRPGTTYRYAIGDGAAWGEERSFTTAPAQAEPFSFIYMGDAQNGLDTWGTLVRKARAEHPQAAFYVMAGDLVNWGERRDDWDLLFQNAHGVYDNRPLVPAVGNHEVDMGHVDLYVGQFDLPRNGPAAIEPERVYSMEYGDTLFVVLDSNLEPGPQVEWLDRTLGASDATWKFVVYHHPLYSTKPGDRGQPELKAAWAPLFEKHGVDLVLQGDDHAYLRTFPMKGDEVVGSPAEGPVYIHAVAGTKMYEQSDAPHVAKRFTDISTYQVIDIDGGRLQYTSYDVDGRVMDEFSIEK